MALKIDPTAYRTIREFLANHEDDLFLFSGVIQANGDDQMAVLTNAESHIEMIKCIITPMAETIKKCRESGIPDSLIYHTLKGSIEVAFSIADEHERENVQEDVGASYARSNFKLKKNNKDTKQKE